MNNPAMGWILVIVSCMLLAASNRLSLLLILMPGAMVLGCGFLWLGRNMNRVRPGLK